MNARSPAALMPASGSACVIAVTSGKGGVGKTSVSTNLGISLAAQGCRVCIFDADTGMANVNVLLGQTPAWTLEHLFTGECDIDDLLVEGPHGVQVVPAASGIAECAELDAQRQAMLVEALTVLEGRFDYLILDTAAGGGESVLRFLQSARYAIIVITPEPTSLTNAFSLLKILRNRSIDREAYVVANQVNGHAHGVEVFRRLQGAVRKYLKSDVRYLGHVVADAAVTEAIRHQRPLVDFRADAPASRCFRSLAETVAGHFGRPAAGETFSGYWKRIVNITEPPSDAIPPPRPGALPSKPEGLARALRRQLTVPGIDQDRAGELLAPLIETYISRFCAFPYDVRRALFRWLEQGEYPEEQMTALVLTLEDMYSRRHGRPLLDPEYAIARVLATDGLDEERMGRLVRDIEQVFERRFGKPIETPVERLRSAILDGSLSEEEAREAVKSITRAFEKRHPPALSKTATAATVTYIGGQAAVGGKR